MVVILSAVRVLLCNLYLHVSNNSWLCASFHVHFFLKCCELCLPFHMYWWNSVFVKIYFLIVTPGKFLRTGNHSLILLVTIKSPSLRTVFKVLLLESGHKVPAFLWCQYCLLAEAAPVEVLVGIVHWSCSVPEATPPKLGSRYFFFCVCQFDVQFCLE